MHVSHARALVGAGGATRNAINLDQEDEEESDSDGGKEASGDGEAEKGAIDPHTFGRCGSGLRLPHSPPLAGPRQWAEPRRHTKERTESDSSSLSYACSQVQVHRGRMTLSPPRRLTGRQLVSHLPAAVALVCGCHTAHHWLDLGSGPSRAGTQKDELIRTVFS